MEAVQYLEDGTPVLELSAQEWVFAVSFEHGGREVVAAFHMTPYLPRELDETLRLGAPTFRRDKNWLRADAIPTEKMAELFDRHFLHLSGLSGDYSLDAQRSFLDRKVALKKAVFVGGYGGVRRPPSSTNGAGKLPLVLDSPNIIETEIPLWSAAKERGEILRVSHRLRDETDSDLDRYERAARRAEVHTRNRETRVSTDYLALGTLYDAMIQSLDGAVLDGVPCTDANRQEWVGRVPLWHKSFVLDELFGAVTEKND